MLAKENNEKEGGIFDDFAKKIVNSFEEAFSKFGGSFFKNTDFNQIAKVVVEMDNAAVNVAKSFGQGRENVLELSKSMGDAYTKVALLGGEMSEINKMQIDVSEELGRNVILHSDSYEKLYAAMKVSGVETREIVKNFKDAGYSAYQSAQQIENVVNIARESGVNAKSVSKLVVDNLSKLNSYNFEGGVIGLAKMAAQATMLRIDMKDTLSFADKMFDPDKAIDAAAAMQRLGVANSELLDPLRLMDLGQNDPTELQNQLSKMAEQFVRLNEKGQFEIMPGAKGQLREIESALNLNNGSLSKMAIGAKELDEKMSRIKLPENTFTKEQEQMIMSMAEMGEGGKFVITMDSRPVELEEAIKELTKKSEEDRNKFFEASKPKSLEVLAQNQLTISEQINAHLAALEKTSYAIAGTKVAKEALEAQALLVKEGAGILNKATGTITELRKGLGGAAEDVLKISNEILKGKASPMELLGTLGKIEEQFKTFSEQKIDDVSKNYKNSIDKLTEANNSWINIMINGYDLIKGKIVEFEKLPKYTNLGFESKNDSLEKLKNLNNSATEQTNNTPAASKETTLNHNVNFKIDINAPTNIDNTQLQLAFENTGVRESMIQTVKEGLTGDNLYSITSNPQKQTYKMINTLGSTGIPG